SSDVNQFGGDDAVCQIFCALVLRTLRNCQYPSHLAATLFGVDEIGDGNHFQSAFDHPVEAGEPRIEHTVLDVASHFLGADQHAIDLRICRSCKVRAAIGVDLQAGAGEQLQGRFLQ